MIKIDFFLEYLNDNNIYLDRKEFEFQLNSHPDFPSLFAFSSALNFFSVENVVAEIPNKELNHLPPNFLGIISHDKQNSLTYIKKTENSFSYFENGRFIKISNKEFVDQWNGVILVVNKIDKPLKQLNSESKIENVFLILLILILFLVLFSIKEYSTFILFFEPLSILGLYISVEAFRKKHDMAGSIATRFCQLITKEDECASLIKTEKDKLISFSDLGIIFFSFQIIAGTYAIYGESYLNYSIFMKLGVIVSIVPIFFSLYTQLISQKKICTLCLAIIIILVAQGIIVFAWNDASIYEISYNFLSLFYVFLSVILLVGWLRLKKIIVKNAILQNERINLIKFKKTYSIFINSLLSNEKLLETKGYDLVTLGLIDSKIKISIVTNPFCEHCEVVHSSIEKILSNFPNDVSAEIIFNIIPEKTNKDMEYVHLRLLDIFINGGKKLFLKAYKDWYEIRSVSLWRSQYGKIIVQNESYIKSILVSQFESNTKNKIIFTPTIFINNYKFPDNYAIEDLQYFIEELISESKFNTL